MIQIAALIVSFIPAILIYIYLRNLRKDDENYIKTCRKLLLSGAYCTVLVVLFSLTCTIAWGAAGLDKLGVIPKELFRTFILAALSEELAKYYISNKAIKKERGSITMIDVLAYAAIAGMGFELVESFVYMFTTNVGQILVRGLMFMHVCYGLLMGWYIVKSIITGKKSYRVLAVVLPWILHGLYDFSLSEDLLALNDNLVFLPFIMVFVTLFIGIRLLLFIRKAQKNGLYTEPLPSEVNE